MNTQQRTRTLRAAEQIQGARAGRLHLTRTGVIARQLDTIAPGTVAVRTLPVHIDDDRGPRTCTWVILDNALGQAVTADRAAHRAARQLLHHMFPGLDWTRPQDYDAASGTWTQPAPAAMPAELTGDAR